MSDPLARVRLLMQHQRFADAEREARGILTQEPGDHLSHALLALCLVHREAWQEATREAESAIHLAPDDAFGHYALAHVLFARNRHADALRAVTEAIRLDPHHEGQWALSSRIHFAEQRWEEALADAERGLEIDADDVTCNNLRTLTLEKLGRAEFAQSSAAETSPGFEEEVTVGEETATFLIAVLAHDPGASPIDQAHQDPFQTGKAGVRQHPTPDPSVHHRIAIQPMSSPPENGAKRKFDDETRIAAETNRIVDHLVDDAQRLTGIDFRAYPNAKVSPRFS